MWAGQRLSSNLSVSRDGMAAISALGAARPQLPQTTETLRAPRELRRAGKARNVWTAQDWQGPHCGRLAADQPCVLKSCLLAVGEPGRA